jgi:hypothetical protein
VREQLEHDRVIRLLQAKFRRRFETAINPGSEQNTPVNYGATAIFPDVVLLAQGRGRRLEAVVEVETGESVNHLEALAQWASLGKLRAAFHLYVPSNMVDVARRLCEDNQIPVNEIWTYHAVGEEVRFTLVHRLREQTPAPRPRGAARSATAARRKSPAPAKRAGSQAGRARKTKPAARKIAKKASATQRRK